MATTTLLLSRPPSASGAGRVSLPLAAPRRPLHEGTWLDDPEAKALLASFADKAPRAEWCEQAHVLTRDEWVEYRGPRVDRLLVIFVAHSVAAIERADAGDRTTYEAHRQTDPLIARGHDSVPPYLWLSRPVDRVIWVAVHGEGL